MSDPISMPMHQQWSLQLSDLKHVTITNKHHTLDQDFTNILKQITSVSLIFNHKGQVTSISEQTHPLLQKVAEILPGKTLWEVFPEAANSSFYQKYFQALETQPSVHFEEYSPVADKWFEVHSYRLQEGIVVHLQDITLRKQAETKLFVLAAIVESSDDAIISKTLDGIVTSWNAGAEHLYGYKAEEMIGQSIKMVIPTDRLEEFPTIMQQIVGGQRIEHFETIRRRKDGSLIEVSIIISPVRDATGKIIGTSTIAHDITERKQAGKVQDRLLAREQVALLQADRANQVAKRSEARLQRLVDSNIVGIVFWDIDGNITEANDIFLKMVGYTREDLLAGKVNWMEMTPPEYVYLDVKALDEMKANGAVSDPFEKEYIRKDGSRVPILLGGAFLDSSQRDGVCFIIDMSRVKELEQRKDDFISMASHELKTPLTSVIGYADLLQKMLEKENRGKESLYLSKMQTQIMKLSKLVADLLDISKIQGNKIVLTQEIVDIDELVQEVVETIQHITPQHQIIIEETAQRKIQGDRDRLGQVLINLLTNAIKYSAPTEKVIVRVGLTNEQVVISVQDFGIGIPKQHQEKIFERFYRVYSDKDKKFPGLGIGLYIAHEIIIRHDGKIWVESVEGKGSTFSIALPFTE